MGDISHSIHTTTHRLCSKCLAKCHHLRKPVCLKSRVLIIKLSQITATSCDHFWDMLAQTSIPHICHQNLYIVKLPPSDLFYTCKHQDFPGKGNINHHSAFIYYWRSASYGVENWEAPRTYKILFSYFLYWAVKSATTKTLFSSSGLLWYSRSGIILE